MRDEQKQIGFRLTTRQLELLAVGLGVLVALVHMFHPDRGVARLTLLLSADPGLLLAQPRPIAFVASSFLVLVGASALALGVSSRGIYAAGMALMVTYVGGYFAWHFSGHGGFLPNREPLHHGLAPHEAVISHLSGSLLATTAVVTEVLLLLVCASLFWRQRSGNYPSPSD
jgi:hypothetical protein